MTRTIALTSLLLGLVACSEAKQPRLEPGAADYAGGETSEFSGGSAPLGYCPIEESRTALDLGREDVASWLALATGRHTVELRWKKRFPDPAIRGFEESTTLTLDVTPIAAEDVLCRTGGAGGYEAEGIDGKIQRRFELGIELASADGAIQAAFPARFFPLRDVNHVGERLLGGGSALIPFGDVAGSLELGVDPALLGVVETLAVQLTFDGRAPRGSLEPRVTLPGRIAGGGPIQWSPVTATFPAPGLGCDEGVGLPLDELYAPIGITPRAAHEEMRALLPSAPITGAWLDEINGPREPGDLPWAEVTLSAGDLLHACALGVGDRIDLYTTLRITTADGRVGAEPSVVAHIVGFTTGGRELGLYMRSTAGFIARPEFEASAGVPELELGQADYAAFLLSQSLSTNDDLLQGELRFSKWENHREQPVDKPALRWCAGPGCEHLWCVEAMADEARCSAR